MRQTAKRITNGGAAMHTHTGQNATTDKAHFFYENVAKLLSKKLCQGMLNSVMTVVEFNNEANEIQ